MKGYEIEKQLTNLLDDEAKRIMNILLFWLLIYKLAITQF